MAKNSKTNDWKDRLNVVYSTNPDFQYETEHEEETPTLPLSQQRLRVQLDRKNRGGKTVTLVTCFVGTGVGGSAKDGEIIIQGDFKQKVAELLVKAGYTQTKTIG